MARTSGAPCASGRRLLLLSAVLAWPFAGEAQTVVTGRVSAGGKPLAGALVTAEPQGVSAEVGEDGRYLLLVPVSGPSRIEARAVGHASASRRYLLVAHDTLSLNFTLAPAPQLLAPIEVEAPVSARSARLQAFEERRLRGTGQFLTRSELEPHGSAQLSRVLRGAVNLRLLPRNPGCGGGFAVGSGRGTDRLTVSGRELEALRCAGVKEACYFAIYLDGMAFWLPGNPPGPPDVDGFRADELEAIEVYRGPAQIPPEYNLSFGGCGVVLLWTRAGS